MEYGIHTILVPVYSTDFTAFQKLLGGRAHDCNHLREMKSIIQEILLIPSLEKSTTFHQVPELKR